MAIVMVLVSGACSRAIGPTHSNKVIAPESLYSVSCPTSHDCIAVGEAGKAVITTNAGHGWLSENTATNERLLGVACPSLARCIAVGNNGTIVETDNLGATWKLVKSGTTQGLTSISCPTSTTCLVTAQLGSILRTTDSGVSWAPEETFQAEMTSVSCYKKLCAAVSLRDSLDSPAQVYVSNDSGTSWLGESLSQDVNFYAVTCFSVRSCYAVGDQGNIQETTNFGYIWHQNPLTQFGTLNSIYCVSPTSCVTAGQFGQFFKESGHGWVLNAPGGNVKSHQTIQSIACSGSKFCVAVGDQGTIEQATHVGGPWKVVHLSPASNFQRVLLVGDSVAQTFGAELPPLAQPYGLYFVDEGILGCGLAQGEPVQAAGITYPAVAPPCNGQPGTAQWPTLWASYISQLKPSVAIVLAGFWEVTNRMFNGQWSNITQPGYQAYIKGQIQEAVSVLAKGGTRVVLLTSPYFDTGNYPEDDPARVDIYNSLLKEVAAENPSSVTLIDLNRFVDPGGIYTSKIGTTTVRQADGEHFSTAGSELVGKWLLPQIAALAGQGR